MARKTYSEEFRRQAVELYGSTPGATLRGIATDLGITRGTLATWVAALDPDPTTGTTGTTDAAAPPAGGGTARPRPGSPQAELAALRARVAVSRGVGDREHPAGHRAGHPAPGGQVFRRGDALVTRFQFVADHRDTFEVKRLCEIVDARSSTWRARRSTRGWPPRPHELCARARTRRWRSGSARSTTPTALRGFRGSPPSSTTAPTPAQTPLRG